MCIESIYFSLQSVLLKGYFPPIVVPREKLIGCPYFACFYVFFQVVEQIKNSRGEREARRHLVNVVTARDLVR